MLPNSPLPTHSRVFQTKTNSETIPPPSSLFSSAQVRLKYSYKGVLSNEEIGFWEFIQKLSLMCTSFKVIVLHFNAT